MSNFNYQSAIDAYLSLYVEHTNLSRIGMDDKNIKELVEKWRQVFYEDDIKFLMEELFTQNAFAELSRRIAVKFLEVMKTAISESTDVSILSSLFSNDITQDEILADIEEINGGLRDKAQSLYYDSLKFKLLLAGTTNSDMALAHMNDFILR
jgi:hypothetical protein